MNKFIRITVLAVAGGVIANVNAAVSLDRTRVIFPGNSNSISLKIGNQNKELPYLAQAWLEDENGRKINSPFTVLPPIQRLEPEMVSMLKVQSLPAVAHLPQDKESLYYFNLREIPPKSGQTNTLQLALQTKVKFFYRPQALVIPQGSSKTPWQEQLTLHPEASGYRLENPTPYYVTIVEAATATTLVAEFDGVMLPPNGRSRLNLAGNSLGTNPTLTYVDDYGGRRQLVYKCNSSCQLVVKNK